MRRTQMIPRMRRGRFIIQEKDHKPGKTGLIMGVREWKNLV